MKLAGSKRWDRLYFWECCARFLQCLHLKSSVFQMFDLTFDKTQQIWCSSFAPNIIGGRFAAESEPHTVPIHSLQK